MHIFCLTLGVFIRAEGLDPVEYEEFACLDPDPVLEGDWILIRICFFLPDPESELTFTPRRGGNSVALEGLDPEPYFSEIRIRRKTIGSLAPGVYINIHTTYAK